MHMNHTYTLKNKVRTQKLVTVGVVTTNAFPMCCSIYTLNFRGRIH